MKLTEEELRHLMTDLELENVERTRAFEKADKMGQAICAFANDISNRGTPGYLLLGVENDGKISGRRINDELLTSLGGLKTEGNLLPPPAMALDVFHFTEGDVVVFTIFPSAYPPIRYHGQVWIRIGSRKALATEEDIHLLEERRQQSGRRFEERPCIGAKLDDLNLDLFRNVYLPKAIQAEVIEEDSRPIQAQLAALYFFDLETNTPTNLGILLFGKHPDQFIPSAYLQYVKLSALDNSGDVLAEHAYKGPLLKTLPELDSFVKVGIACPHPVRTTTWQEKTVYVYPYWSTRELLLNAIIHGDYEISNAPIRFYDYNGTRLEITNTGGPYGRVNLNNLTTVNDYRNPRLAEAIKVLSYVNKYNLGIRKVKAEMKQNGNPDPVFEVITRNVFRVILRPAVDVPLEEGVINSTPSQKELSNDEKELSKGLSNDKNDPVVAKSDPVTTKSAPVSDPVAVKSDPASDSVVAKSDPASDPVTVKSDSVTTKSDPVWAPVTTKSDPVSDPVLAKSDPVSDPVVAKRDPVKRLIRILNDEMSPMEMRQKLGITHRTYFRRKYLDVAMDKGYVELTLPDSPNSPKQKYRLTEKGHVLLKELVQE